MTNKQDKSDSAGDNLKKLRMGYKWSTGPFTHTPPGCKKSNGTITYRFIDPEQKQQDRFKLPNTEWIGQF